jgi:hypothetical protein
VQLTVRDSKGAVVVDRTIFQSDFHLAHPGSVDRDSHFASGTRQNLGPTACLDGQPQDCQGAQRLRLFATPEGRYWDTGRVKNGAHTLTVQAWDLAGNAATRTVQVRVR